MLSINMGDLRSDLGHFVVDNAVAGLIAAVIIGNSGDSTIQSLIKNIIMPAIHSITGFTEEQWDSDYVEIFGSKFKFRAFAADAISFFITVVITFVFLQYFALPLIAGSKYKAGPGA